MVIKHKGVSWCCFTQNNQEWTVSIKTTESYRLNKSAIRITKGRETLAKGIVERAGY